MQAAIEQYYDMSLANSPPELLAFVAQQSKASGNDAFKRRNYKGAPSLLSPPVFGHTRQNINPKLAFVTSFTT